MSDGCNCVPEKRLVGDGCQYCNPQMAIDLLEERVQELRFTPEEREPIAEHIEVLDAKAKRMAEFTQPYSDAVIFYSKKADTLRNLLERHA